MGDLRSDIKHSLQMFARIAGFTSATNTALVLGIGPRRTIRSPFSIAQAGLSAAHTGCEFAGTQASAP
jgi:hypothetical protein